jgi:hypothetical protein
MGLMTGYLQLQRNLDAIYRPNSLANPTSVADALVSQPLLAVNFMLFSGAGTDFAAIDLIVVALSLIGIGFIIHNFLMKNYLRIKRYLYLIIFAILVKYLSTHLYWAIVALQSESTTIEVAGFDPIQNVLISLLISFVVILVAHYLLKIVFFDYIARKKQLEERYMGKEVVSKKGKKLGRVSKIVMRGSELNGINIKRKYYPISDVHAKGKVLVVNE